MRSAAANHLCGGGWTCIFGTVHPATGDGFALVLPEVSTRTMALFPAEFAKTPAPDEHAVMVLDGAGRHASTAMIKTLCLQPWVKRVIS